MIEIYIPINIKGLIKINNYDLEYIENLLSGFNGEIKKFESNFFEGIEYKQNTNDTDIFILLNGLFGKYYFSSYDFNNKDIISLSYKFFEKENIKKDTDDILKNFEEIIKILKSNTLITKSKTEEIKTKIIDSVFLLSGIDFMLNMLLNKTNNNLIELDLIDNNKEVNIELQSNSSLIKESLINKKIELEAQIEKLYLQLELFIQVVNKFLI